MKHYRHNSQSMKHGQKKNYKEELEEDHKNIMLGYSKCQNANETGHSSTEDTGSSEDNTWVIENLLEFWVFTYTVDSPMIILSSGDFPRALAAFVACVMWAQASTASPKLSNKFTIETLLRLIFQKYIMPSRSRRDQLYGRDLLFHTYVNNNDGCNHDTWGHKIPQEKNHNDENRHCKIILKITKQVIPATPEKFNKLLGIKFTYCSQNK